MSIDMSSLMSVYNSSLLNKASSNPINKMTNTNFSDYLLDVLGNRKSTTSTDENALYKALTSSTNANTLQAMLASGSSSTALTQYLANYTGDSNTNPVYSSYFNNTNETKNSEYYSDTLASSFETQMISVLTGAKTKLENNMTMYAEKMGDNESEAVQQTLTRMQNNISVIENYLSQKSTENGLMNALNLNSTLTQYLITKNNTVL